jgi:hypothetical protein
MSNNPSYITKGNKGNKGSKREKVKKRYERGKIRTSNKRGEAKKTRRR